MSIRLSALHILILLAACGTGTGSGSDIVAAPDEMNGDNEYVDKSIELRAELAGCQSFGSPGATSSCLTPVESPEYYIEQANRYFDTLDVDADPASVPLYSEFVARWEWPPWLLLTGLGAKDMIEVSEGLKVLDPSTVPERDCRFFPVQPFARCRVVFHYANGPCPIYEEFTFNDEGEMTFIEAWSDLPGMLPQGLDDPWAEAVDYPRLSTRVPGLGNSTGLIDLSSSWMAEASAVDPEVADFALRATDWWKWWMEAVNNAEEGYFAKGCGWTEVD